MRSNFTYTPDLIRAIYKEKDKTGESLKVICARKKLNLQSVQCAKYRFQKDGRMTKGPAPKTKGKSLKKASPGSKKRVKLKTSNIPKDFLDVEVDIKPESPKVAVIVCTLSELSQVIGGIQ